MSTASVANGRPLQVANFLLYQDPDNPRTEFAEENIDDLAHDIREADAADVAQEPVGVTS